MTDSHGKKLKALSKNNKLPKEDKSLVEATIKKYQEWIRGINNLSCSGFDCIKPMVESLNQYKKFVDLNLIFDSKEDFLYRQKGQTKLDSSIIEEFLPFLVNKVFQKEIKNLGLLVGPTKSLSQVIFNSNISDMGDGGGITIKIKDHDFVISHKLHIQTSHSKNFNKAINKEIHLPYIAVEIKTNLDKTMFQEAGATAHDLKVSIPNAKYFMICEWLDMTPINTSSTAIESILILRNAKRLSANIRKSYSTYDGRMRGRDEFEKYLEQHPIRDKIFKRFLEYVELALGKQNNEDGVLQRGWF